MTSADQRPHVASARGAAAHVVPGVRTSALVRELVAERQRQRLSNRELVERIPGKWSLGTLRNCECGNQNPTVEFLALWAEALGRPLVLSERAS